MLPDVHDTPATIDRRGEFRVTPTRNGKMGAVTDDSGPASDPATLSVDDLGAALRDIVEFVDPAGWGQPPMLFALVPTAILAASQPGLIAPDDDSVLSPIAQEPFPRDTTADVAAVASRADEATSGDTDRSKTDLTADIERALATTSWPAAVAGAALIQEIVVLPPEAEGTDTLSGAAAHPERRVARLIVGALRSGTTLGLLHLRPDPAADVTDGDIELLTRHDLAADLRTALAHTFDES